MCGENRRASSRAICTAGSPPRVRGKPRSISGIFFLSRITPACAGKTINDYEKSSYAKDHPRVCGENAIFTRRISSKAGSPPRVRGKHAGWDFGLPAPRITPACAGKTLRKWRISVVDPSPQPRSSLTSRRADASIGSQRAPCAAPV